MMEYMLDQFDVVCGIGKDNDNPKAYHHRRIDHMKNKKIAKVSWKLVHLFIDAQL